MVTSPKVPLTHRLPEFPESAQHLAHYTILIPVTLGHGAERPGCGQLGISLLANLLKGLEYLTINIFAQCYDSGLHHLHGSGLGKWPEVLPRSLPW